MSDRDLSKRKGAITIKKGNLIALAYTLSVAKVIFGDELTGYHYANAHFDEERSSSECSVCTVELAVNVCDCIEKISVTFHLWTHENYIPKGGVFVKLLKDGFSSVHLRFKEGKFEIGDVDVGQIQCYIENIKDGAGQKK